MARKKKVTNNEPEKVVDKTKETKTVEPTGNIKNLDELLDIEPIKTVVERDDKGVKESNNDVVNDAEQIITSGDVTQVGKIITIDNDPKCVEESSDKYILNISNNDTGGDYGLVYSDDYVLKTDELKNDLSKAIKDFEKEINFFNLVKKDKVNSFIFKLKSLLK